MKFKPEIRIVSDQEALAKEGAALFSETVQECISRFGQFTVALSGGSTPRLMHRYLAREPYLGRIPWERTFIFWGDERCVSAGHPQSNFGAARSDFLDKIPVPEKNIFPMPGEAPPSTGSREYEVHLKNFFKVKKNGLPAFPMFNLIFLGLGTDGHTASLFPGQGAVEERERLVIDVRGGNPEVNRLTLTLPVLNAAGKIIFLVTGKKKADMVHKVLNLNPSRKEVPARGVNPEEGALIWLVDKAAADKL